MDKSMNQLVAEFPAQMKEALEIASTFGLQNKSPFTNVVICGLGGSGIGGTILSQLIQAECPYPVTASKDYSIPGFVNENTLLIACSYSGNTEETLEALNNAISKQAQIVCVTSGGKLLEMATQHNWPHIKIPGGYPPRSAFGFSLVQLFRIAEEYGLCGSAWRNHMESAMNFINKNQSDIKAEGEKLAQGLHGKMPIVYAASWMEGVATRWRQQINENAKMLCWHHYYPEQNHNELVGWRTEDENLAVIFLKSNEDHYRVTKRMELSHEVYKKYTPNIYSFSAIGDSKIEQAVYLIHLGDWMSVALADLKGADSTEVKVIDWLKGELAKV
ncbi:MAG: bifunctional phosphoglucose/phosphomannose isomerase [Salibacteraceae bacterium]